MNIHAKNNVELFDSHAHIDFATFGIDQGKVLERAWQRGVVTIVAIGADRGLEGAFDAVKLAEQDKRIWATIGIHPHDAGLGVKEKNKEEFRRVYARVCNNAFACLNSLALHPKVVAIGEVGLDFHYDYSPQELQREVFRRSIRLAIRLGLPLVFHIRKAEREAYSILKQEQAWRTRGVIHCFSGDADLASLCIEKGLYLGLNGILTFKKSNALRDMVANLPIEQLVVETDCPFLAPMPYRGKRNEPAYVAEVVQTLARVKNMKTEDVGRITKENARKLFGIDEREKRLNGRIAYEYKNALYLNITNRCTLGCCFCLKHKGYKLGNINLALQCEPSSDKVIRAIEANIHRTTPKEVVFCGLGEPLLRPEVVVEVSRYLKARHALRVRVNTDGLANLVHSRDVVTELAGNIDSLSVSLNAECATTYARICPCVYGERAFSAVCDFIRSAAHHIPSVRATVVRVPEVNVEAACALAKSLGATFHVRELV